ncbi:Prolyl oligopeptidase family protein [compost metagenome]
MLFNQNKYVHPDVYLVNLNDGSRLLIKSKAKVVSLNFPPYYLSPSGKGIVYFDNEKSNYYYYNIEDSKIKCISNGITVGFNNGDNANGEYKLQGEYFRLRSGGSQDAVFWVEEDSEHVVVFDRKGNLWQLSLDAAKPVCLTGSNSDGKSLAFVPNQTSNVIVKNNVQLLGYSSASNDASFIGYFNFNILNRKFNGEMTFPVDYEVSDLKKANDDNMYVWTLQNTNLPPTVYFGKTFKKCRKLSERDAEVNPVIQEIIKWQDEEGNTYSGTILFPITFNPNKKYPVIVNYYYSKMETTLGSSYLDYNNFRSELDLDYILFIPSIRFKVGFTSLSIVNSITLGVQELKKKRYISADRVGLFGGSFGGYETNCIIGQTDVFAAAYSIAGLSNITSSIGLEDMDSEQRNDFAALTNGQMNMAVTLWQRPDLYLASSPIMFADRVTCPVLLYHGRKDFRVPFQQGMEFYKALQANGKKVWLDAPIHGHMGAPLGSAISNIKARQFFGHYLKDEPAPYWMTRPALELLEKGLNPYDYDPEIKTPGEGIIPEEKIYAPQVLELLKHRTRIDKYGRIVDAKK